MAQPGEETIVRTNWVAWTFNFCYPLIVTFLGVFIISQYFGLPIAGDIGKEFAALIHNGVNALTIWIQKLF
ncbi:hypothetical protein [Mesorhizobium sp. IMUNJ 23232]|uniref:hypothetical protein n=1 Tax=Mesorhizobium sp. IMUNJ 23232 TaxID=3376064 RepID=UPI00378DFDB7